LLLGELAMLIGEAGDLAQALTTVDDALSRCQAREEGWYIAELLRLKGELMLAGKATGAAALSGELFLGGVDPAAGQDAHAWELRAATSLARLKVQQGRPTEAEQVLAPVYDWFTEGFETADLRAARAVLAALPKA